MEMVTVTAQGVRLVLRPFVASDAADYYALVRDYAVAAPAGFTPAHSFSEAEFLLKQQLKLPQVYAIVVADQRRVVGSVGLYERMNRYGEPAPHELDLGYMLNAADWHQGIMTAAVTRIQRYAFESLHLNRITASCLADNVASKLILERANFHKYDQFRHPQHAPFGAGQMELFYDCVGVAPAPGDEQHATR
ncbi:GNAT family N-acetyltransferase [Lactiplantibacillus modestisalitolerans]|uniref:GNAT family N-acetyltransferase n=1 Tax=Lactiplantibacillus modestisalitolerans TaxID=1457219 RepID=A0ABV5WUT9_9LACO|nr:GNAT family N-acetyltransferase [Lactiplantibacillus modestisalitolerans]